MATKNTTTQNNTIYNFNEEDEDFYKMLIAMDLSPDYKYFLMCLKKQNLDYKSFEDKDRYNWFRIIYLKYKKKYGGFLLDWADDQINKPNPQMCLDFEGYMYLMDCIADKKQLKAIKKAYIKKGLEDECFYVEYGLDLTDEEQKEVDRLEGWECYIKVKFEEDEVINEFTHFITYNGSSRLALWFCGVMQDD